MRMSNGASPSKTTSDACFAAFSKQTKIRCSIIKEIVRSEREYLKMLRYIVNVIKDDLEICAEKIEYEIDEGQVRALFGNITDVLDIHDNLLHAITSDLGKPDEELASTDDAVRKMTESSIGLRFVEKKDSFHVYEIYSANHARAEKIASEVVKMSTLKSNLQKWAAEGPMCDVTTNEVAMLDMMLAKPFHHICKLQVLLRMLAVFTPSNHADLKQIFDAIQLVQACITSVEKTKRAKILQNAIKSCDDLQLKWDDIGLCNRNGFLTKRGGNVKNWKIRWFTLRGYELKYFDEPVEEKALHTLDLHQCTAVVQGDSQAKPNCFGLVFPERTYYMYAVNPEEKSEWMNLFAWKVFIRHSAEERARLVLTEPKNNKPETVLQLLNC